MAVKKRPAPKRLSKREKLIEWLVDPKSLPEIVKTYDVQRLEWLKAIAAESGIQQRSLGRSGEASNWLFELAYTLAIQIYDGSGLKGRPSASRLEDIELLDEVKKIRRKYPSESYRKNMARVLGISLKAIDGRRYPENNERIQRHYKRYKAAKARLK